MSSPYHQAAAGIHPMAFWQDDDPTTTVVAPETVVPKATWIDTTDGFFRVKRRNDTNDAWVLVGYLGVPPFRTVSAAGAMVNEDELVLLDPTAGAFTLDMLPIANRTGLRSVKFVNIADPATSSNNATLDADTETFGATETTFEIPPGTFAEFVPITATRWERVS